MTPLLMTLAPADLNPGLADLLALRFDPLVWLPVLAVTALYFWHYVRARRTPEGRANWPAWKTVLFGLGVVLLILSTQSAATNLPQVEPAGGVDQDDDEADEAEGDGRTPAEAAC